MDLLVYLMVIALLYEILLSIDVWGGGCCFIWCKYWNNKKCHFRQRKYCRWLNYVAGLVSYRGIAEQ